LEDYSFGRIVVWYVLTPAGQQVSGPASTSYGSSPGGA
jgi:hypothetical protein